MSPLYLYNGKLLVRNGALATSASCCCDNDYYCYKSEDAIPCPCEGEGYPELGYYYFTVRNDEDTVDIVDIGTFTRTDEETFVHTSEEHGTITMKKQPGGPHPINYMCNGYPEECPCPPIDGYWRIEGWDLGAPSGQLVIRNTDEDCNEATYPGKCTRYLYLYDYPTPMPNCFPRSWNGYGDSSGEIKLFAKLDCMPAEVELVSVPWNITYCGENTNVPNGCTDLNISLLGSFPINTFFENLPAECTTSEDPRPSNPNCCIPEPAYCQDDACLVDTTTINNVVSQNPWQETTVYTGVKFVGAGDWDNWNNWTNAANQGPAIPGPNWDGAIYGTLISDRNTTPGDPINLGPGIVTLYGELRMSLACGDIIIDGGQILQPDLICNGTTTVTVTTFLFKNGGLLNNGTLLNGTGELQDTSKNYGEINGDVTFKGSSENHGFVSPVSQAIFEGTSENHGTINGNATFRSGTKNYGTVNGDATFEAGSCNSGTVTGTITGSPPAC
jgi:hypothetical protein